MALTQAIAAAPDFGRRLRGLARSTASTAAVLAMCAQLGGCGGDPSDEGDVSRALVPSVIASSLSGQAPLVVSFEGRVDGASGPVYYLWDFDAADGLAVDRARRAVDWVFPEAGTFTVTLRAMDSSGRSGVAEVQLAVSPRTYERLTDPTLRGRPAEPGRAAEMVYLGEDCGCTASQPCIVEGYEIGPFLGTGIVVDGCDHVIIRNNSIHDLGFGLTPGDDANCTRNLGGIPIHIADSSHVEIHGNIVRRTETGILLDRQRFTGSIETNYLVSNKIHHNVIEHTNLHRTFLGGILAIWNDGLVVSDNQIRSTGGSDVWAHRAHRAQGMQFQGCRNVRAAGNYVNTSTSDSMSSFFAVSHSGSCPIGGVWDLYYNHAIEYADNTLIGGGEMGAWMLGVRGGSIHHNYIQDSCGPGVFLEYGVSDVNVHNNLILTVGDRSTCVAPGGAGPTIWNSQRINVHNNTYVGEDDTVIELVDWDPLAEWLITMGLSPVPSSGIDVRNNLFVAANAVGVDARLGPEQFTAEYNTAVETTEAFLAAADGFYALPEGSPLIGTGDPSATYNNADGTRNTPGAFGGPAGGFWSE